MKDYTSWHELKSQLEARDGRFYFHEREIWFCSIGLNIGYEQDGKNTLCERPVLIIKKFSNDVFLGIPLTSFQKQHKYYFNYEYRGKASSAILTQIRLYDRKRLQRKVRVMNRSQFKELLKQVRKLLT